MFLTTKGRYAVMAMVEVAINGKNKPVTLLSISMQQRIDIGYLEQIFSRLKADQLVKGFKGPRGGYKLAKLSNEITVLDIMKAVDEKMKITRCEGSDSSCVPNTPKCITHNLWEAFELTVFKFLKSISLADVCNKNIINLVNFDIPNGNVYANN